MTTRGLLGVIGFATLLSACGGGGRFGYARTYTYYGNEEHFARQANNDAVYDEVRRLPDHFNHQLLSWFGVVTDVAAGPNGAARIGLQLRTHQERHLCEDETDGSCRVTISEADGGAFTVVIDHLPPEDQLGENRMQAGSLIHVYGRLVPGEYDANGGPVLHSEFYRHWPRGQYVTTAARGNWRR